jgi:hypothetical protein
VRVRAVTLRERFWVRGWTWLGWLNTCLAVAFGVVLVRITRDDITIGWEFHPASDFPRPR